MKELWRFVCRVLLPDANQADSGNDQDGPGDQRRCDALEVSEKQGAAENEKERGNIENR